MNEACVRCQSEFQCGMFENDGPCWCTQYPPLASIDVSQKTCLCPKCLKAKLDERHFRAWVSYDGTQYAGFQEQVGQETIQGALKKAIGKICREQYRFNFAGRTDSGVHAKAQALSISMVTSLDLRKLVLALSHTLPKSIRIFRIDEFPPGFDAKKHAVGKRYVYRVHNALTSDPFQDRFKWHVRRKIDVNAMSEAARFLVGDHDYESFRSAQCAAAHARRCIWSIDVEKVGHEISIDIRGNAFCQNMVRIIVGTLIEVGSGKRSPGDVLAILNAKDRTKAGITAPANGLTLEQVYYPDSLNDAKIPANASFPRYPITPQSWPFRNDEITIGPTDIR